MIYIELYLKVCFLLQLAQSISGGFSWIRHWNFYSCYRASGQI